MHTMTETVAAVVIDLVKSRSHPDRRELQRQVVDALDRVNAAVPPRIGLAPTYSDEFQGLYDNARAAIHATYLVRLHLPEGADCRFGIGVGQSTVVEERDGTSILDGSAWWSARSAIETAKSRENGDEPWARTWFEIAESDKGAPGVPDEAITNAYLLCRDELLASLTPTARRALRGRLLGQTQGQIAEQLGITQSAVSRSLARSETAALAASSLVIEGALG